MRPKENRNQVKNKRKERIVDVVFLCYWHRVNDDVFETCVNTLSKHSSALLQVYTDDRPRNLGKDYGIRWVNVPKDQVEGRRALCKIEQLQRFVKQLKDGDRLIVADVDLYFLDDPFKGFEKDFDLALTTRCHEYIFPINAGVFFLRINDITRRFVDFHLAQCKEPTLPSFIKFRESVRHNRYNPDWGIGQDFLCATWLEREDVPFFGSQLKIIDLGPEYNYCPNTDVFGKQKAGEMIKAAYDEKSVKVLHLKSELKMCIYDGYMEDAVITHLDGKWRWDL